MTPLEPAAVRGLTLEVSNPPSGKSSSVVLIGFESKDIKGDWAVGGIRPMHHTVTDPLPITASMKLDVSLHGDLTYFALVDLDANEVPSAGDLTSGPVVLSKDVAEAPAVFVVERLWGIPSANDPGPGAAEGEPGGPPPPTIETITRTIHLDTEVRPPFLKEGRVLVVGLPPSGGAAYVGPLKRQTTFVWATESIELVWPLEIEAQLPSLGDVVVLLDLDGALEPSVGDLASEPLLDFEPGPEDLAIDITLVGPLTEGGEPSEPTPALDEASD